MATVRGFDLDSTQGGRGDSVSYLEGSAGIRLAQNATVNATGNFGGQNLTVSGLHLGDVIGFAGGVTVDGNMIRVGATTIGSFSGGAGGDSFVVTFHNTALSSHVQTLIKNLTYRNTSESPPANHDLSFNLAGVQRVDEVNIVAVNDAPVVDLNGGNSGTSATLSYAENSGWKVIAPDAAVGDVDSANFNGGSLRVSFSDNGSNSDHLAIQTGDGVALRGNNVLVGNQVIGTFAGGGNGGNLVISFNANATAASVTTLMQHIAYSNTSNNPSTAPREVSFRVVDGDGTANGGSDRATATARIEVASVNDAPVLDLNDRRGGTAATVSYTEGNAPIRIAPNSVIDDADSANFGGGSLTVAFTANAQNSDQLKIVAGGGVTVGDGGTVRVGTTAIGTVSGGIDGQDLVILLNEFATEARVQSLMGRIGYANSSDNPSGADRTVSFTLKDGDGTDHGGSDSGSAFATIRVTGVNDAPVVDLNGDDAGSSTASTYVVNASPTVIAPGAFVHDIDSLNFNGGSLRVSFARNGTNTDQLSIVGGDGVEVNGTSVLVDGHSIGSVSGGVGGTRLLVSFNTNATPDLVSKLMKHIGYSNSSANPSVVQREVSFRIVDGDGTGNGGDDRTTATATIDFTTGSQATIVVSNPGAVTESDSAAEQTITIADHVSISGGADGVLKYIAGSLAFALASGPGPEGGIANLFALNRESGTIVYDRSAFNYLSATESVTANFSFTSGLGPNDAQAQSITLTIQGENDLSTVTVKAPEVAAESDVSDLSVVTIADHVAITDPDASDQAVAYEKGSLAMFSAAGTLPKADPSSLFAVDTDKGTVSYDRADFNYLAETESLALTFRFTSASGPDHGLVQTITLVIKGVNDAPVLSVAPSGGVVEDDFSTTLSVGGALSFSDVDAADTHGTSAVFKDAVWARGPLTADQISALTSGFTVDGDSWDYVVANPLLQFLGASEKIELNFHVTVKDSSGVANDSDTEQVTVTLTGVNDAPVSTAAELTIQEDIEQVLSLSHFGAYSDADGTPIAAVQIVSLGEHGYLEWLDGDNWVAVVQDQIVSRQDIDNGNLRFLPGGNEFGDAYAAIGFKVGDGKEFSQATYTLTVNVDPVDDAPVTDDVFINTNKSTAIGGKLGASDSDPGDAAEFSIAPGDGPLHGTLILNSDGSYTYTPATDYFGTDTFAFTVTDTSGLTAIGTAHVTVAQWNMAKSLVAGGDPGLVGPGQGNDSFLGSTFGDYMDGDGGDDWIDGGAGNDELDGGAGADRIFGGEGADELTGGLGDQDADVFLFNAATDGTDRITDFSSGIDKLEFSASGFGGGLVPGSDVNLVMAAELGQASHQGTNGYFILDNNGINAGRLYWDGNGGSGSDAVAIVDLVGITELNTVSDFLLV
jgi:VCBS repeat-containing protein